MNTISKTSFNSNNAWGFGGISGTRELFDNGFIIETGRAYFRHHPSEAVTKYYCAVLPDFKVQIIGKKSNTVSIYNFDNNWLAVFGDPAESYERFGLKYNFVRSISLI